MKRITLLLGIITSLILFSCAKTPVKVTLDEVESYIQYHPDSALATLRQIDTLLLEGPKEKAQYALLLAMALDKNYVDTTDLRIIQPAIEYYNKKGDNKHRMLSYYYEGRILFNAKRDAEAMVSQTHALECANKTDAGRYLGMIYSTMADLAGRSYCWDEAIGFTQQAETVFSGLQDSLALFQCLEKKWILLSNQGKEVEALEQMDSIQQRGMVPPRLEAEFLMYKAGMMVDTAQVDYRPSLECYFSALSKGARLSVKHLSRYAYALARCGYRQEADSLFTDLVRSGKENSLISGTRMQELLASEGRYEEAYRILRNSLDYQEKRIHQILNQSLFRSQRDYFQALEKQNSLEKEKQKYLFSFILATALLLLILLTHCFIRIHQKTNLKRVEMERLAQALKESLEEKEQTLSDLQVKFKQIHSLRFSQLEDYYKDYEISRRSGAGKRELYDKLLAVIHDIEGDATGQRYLDSIIDQRYHGVMKRLLEECPTLSRQDYLLFSYTAAEFDLSTIGMLLGNISSDAIHMRRSRLRKHLKNINPPSLTDFLAILDLRS